MKNLISGIALAGALTMSSGVIAQDMMFGGDDDAAYAALLWDVMNASNLAGEDAIRAYPYEGIAPHGMMLETFYAKGTINGHTGDLVVKRNYGPEGVSEDQVLNEPGKHLGAITVMFRRESGYDEDNNNWFWAKFLPDGTLDKNPKGMMLAGRVAKGADVGCIACHSGAPGDDMLFTTDHLNGM